MVEEAIVSAMWHRTRKCYVPLTFEELQRKTGVKKSEMARVFSSGVIKMGADSKKLGARIPYIYEITEAGKELHQDMQKGN